MNEGKNYGLCCAGAFCKVLDHPYVTFDHRCIRCNGYLHAICGVIDTDDKTTCPSCCGKKTTTAADESASGVTPADTAKARITAGDEAPGTSPSDE